MLSLGFYINLEYRIDRNDHTINELNKLGITLERFNAIMCAAGNIGCTMSHIKCIELAKTRNYPHVFICEDDITFTNPELLKTHVSKFEKSNIEWDVLVILFRHLNKLRISALERIIARQLLVIL